MTFKRAHVKENLRVCSKGRTDYINSTVCNFCQEASQSKQKLKVAWDHGSCCLFCKTVMTHVYITLCLFNYILFTYFGGCLTHEPFRVGEGRMGNSGWTRVLCLYN